MIGLFINQVKNQCSIYESGVMIYNILKTGTSYKLDYVEIQTLDINNYNYTGYDFYIFNWHHNTLPVSKQALDNIKGLKIGIVLEVGPIEIKPFMKEDLFDAYVVIDPTKEDSGKYYSFARPLEKVDELLPLLSDIPVFGTFGFLVPGKNFGEVLSVANKLKMDCIVRMNLTSSAFTGAAFSISAVKSYSNTLHKFRNKNVDLRITHEYMSKNDLIKWCSQNSLNVFPYYRDLPGLSAVTDQAVVAGRGIAITDCDTFRHMRKYISYYPEQNYLQLSESTLPGVKQMQLDWSNDKFLSKFNLLLSKHMRI